MLAAKPLSLLKYKQNKPLLNTYEQEDEDKPIIERKRKSKAT